MSLDSSLIDRDLVATQIDHVRFSFYTAAEIRAMSVARIHNAEARDRVGNSTKGGIYDQRLGPIDAHAVCVTCHQPTRFCPGHLGHIELSMPVYQPLTFRLMLHILKAKCFNCNRLRLPDPLLDLHAEVFERLARGSAASAAVMSASPPWHQVGSGVAQLDGLLAGAELERAAELMLAAASKKKAGRAKKRKKHDEAVAEPEAAAAAAAAERASGKRAFDASGYNYRSVVEQRVHQGRLFKALLAKASPTCSHCQAKNPKIKADGKRTKVFATLAPDSGKRNDEARIFFGDSFAVKPNKQKKKADNDKNDDDDGGDDDDDKQARRKRDEGGVSVAVGKAVFLTAECVAGHFAALWEHERDARVLNHYVGAFGHRDPSLVWRMFFLDCVAVTATRFRMMKEDQEGRHSHDIMYSRILVNESEVRRVLTTRSTQTASEFVGRLARANVLNQEHCNDLYDFVDPQKGQVGVRQILEKKEGLLRMNMMGKRVNHAARSVISPDVNLATNEIGLPTYFAKNLAIREPVCGYNYERLMRAVVVGAEQWPGANAVEFSDSGRVVSLATRAFADPSRRAALARRLVSGSAAEPVIVHRHLLNSDMVLMNRQPTLHRPSLMAHRVRVLECDDKVLRLHYANCNEYNADFDGDEMNLHVPQDLVAMAEANAIVDADLQYCVPRQGLPARGLIQDHVIAGVLLTKKDTFLTRAEFQQLVWAGCAALEHDRALRLAGAALGRVRLPTPAILRPVERWTGKQLLGVVLRACAPGEPPLAMEAKTRLKAAAWRGHSEEGRVLVRHSELLTGVLDKSQVGASSFGVVHCAFELYGGPTAGRVLSSLGRLFSTYLQSTHGFTCGVEDLLLTERAERERAAVLRAAETQGVLAAAAFAGVEGADDAQHVAELRPLVNRQLRRLLTGDNADDALKALDSRMTGALQGVTSDAIAACFPDGLRVPFLRNGMTLMTTSGAKGSQVNASQISVQLGSQELEGRRVPLLATGKSLPCYESHSASARAGGFVSDRFLTGVRPQEYFFHCMAGREGLVDTAVKTSRSGYLQRCLVKHLENYTVAYDGTVRDTADDSIVQFAYGGDSLDASAGVASFVGGDEPRFDFYDLNYDALSARYNIDQLLRSPHVRTAAAVAKDYDGGDPIVSTLLPATHLGSVSQRFAADLEAYLRRVKLEPLRAARFRDLMRVKYMRSVVPAGEGVGVLAAQSLGEPSTQMTLNSFHHSGMAGFDISAGIPRLREVLMSNQTSADGPGPGIMTLPLVRGATRAQADKVANVLARVPLAAAVESLACETALEHSANEGWQRKYRIKLRLKQEADYRHLVPRQSIVRAIATRSRANLLTTLVLLFQRALKSKSMVLSKTHAVDGADEIDMAHSNKKAKEADPSGAGNDDGDDNDDDDDDDDDDASIANEVDEDDSQAEEASDDSDDDDSSSSARRSDDGSETVDPASTSHSMTTASMTVVDEPEAATLEANFAWLAAKGTKEEQTAEAYFDTVFFDAADNRNCTIVLKTRPSERKVLCLQLAEAAIEQTVVRSIQAITKAAVSEQADKSLIIRTNGINLPAAFCLSPKVIDMNRITCSSPWQMTNAYGIEVGAQRIVHELREVFGAYGIGVDARHMWLVAESMTVTGYGRGFNRQAFAHGSASPFQQMSYEMMTRFLSDAALSHSKDALKAPSARIILGKPVKTGTGTVDAIFQVHQQQQKK